jgi:AraC-like DNA-binding protein
MTDLKKIQLKQYKPCAQLQDYVQAIWFVKNNKNRQKLDFKILSDCGSGVILNFGDDVIYQTKNKQRIAHKESTTLGPGTDLITISFNNNIHCFGIRFFPATGHHFLHFTMEKMKGCLLATNDKHFKNSTVLYQNVMTLLTEGASNEDIVGVIENHLLDILKHNHSTRQTLLIEILYSINNKEVFDVNQLCDTFDISLRNLQRLFKTYIGITANAYIRINKIRKIKTTIANDQFKSLTQLSNDYDYFDQAHFIREFKTFMEETPKKYHQFKKQ